MAFPNGLFPAEQLTFGFNGAAAVAFSAEQQQRANMLRSHPGFANFEAEMRLAAALQMRARNEFANRPEPLPPGVEEFLDNGNNYRERGRERERDQREGRSREPERDRGRDRERRRDYDRDRSREWSGERESGRDGSRSGRHRDRGSNRERSPSRSGRQDERDYGHDDGDRNIGGSDRSRNRESESREGRSSDGDKWVTAQPSRTIILRGLSHEVDEKMIGGELMLLGLPVKDIRLIRRASGVSRGFAFVEFHNGEDAKRWMDHTQGNLLLLNQYRAYMDYSISKERQNSRDNNLQRNDWVCIKCLGHNFKRRDYCYNCNLPRKESEKGKSPDGQDEVGNNPCNTLIFRGLDALTTEEGLVTALNQAISSNLAPIKNVAIIRDDLNTSRGFGFVEFHTVSASTLVLESLNKANPPLEVDGKQLLINYAKNTFNTTMATIQQQQSSQYYENYYQQQQQQQGGQYYDAATQQYYDSQYYNQSTTTAGTTTNTTTTTTSDSTNAAAAVAHAAIQQAQAVKNLHKQVQKSVVGTRTSTETVTVNGVEYPVYPPPDTSSYQYDETSGYYYDPMTQLYYDASSQYYYNSTTGQYMYWDADKSTYLPAPTSSEDSSPFEEKNRKDGREKKDKEKVKVAKKIAKDMEKWAKSMNAQKEAMKDGFKRPGQLVGMPPAVGNFGVLQESATADAGFAMLTKAKEDKSLMPPPPATLDQTETPAPPGSKPGLVASYGGDSDSGEEDEGATAIDESKLVDWTKLACLLCKRQFQSKEILSKHIQMSDLHKENLEQLSKSRGASGGDKIEYRDRAKERRQKYGAPEPPVPRKRKDREEATEEAAPVPFEEPTKFGIGGDNIGNKLLQKMGWSHGQGLGKANQGRTDPVEAQRRNQSAGLGARGSNVVSDVGDSYRDALRKTMYARYNEME